MRRVSREMSIFDETASHFGDREGVLDEEMRSRDVMEVEMERRSPMFWAWHLASPRSSAALTSTSPCTHEQHTVLSSSTRSDGLHDRPRKISIRGQDMNEEALTFYSLEASP